MRYIKAVTLMCLVAVLNLSCFEDGDDNQITSSSINDFIWKGMNVYYLYKDFDPVRENLSNDKFGINGIDNRFTVTPEYVSYLNSYSSPENFFESLIYEPETVDKYSWIVDDYIALEQLFSGVSTNNGMEYQLFLQEEGGNDLVGVVRLVLKNSDAENKGLKRGDLFHAVNGVQLTRSNYRSLLTNNSFELNMALYNNNGTPENTDDTIEPTGESITLNKLEYSENPIYFTNIYEVNGENVGYLMYNGFTANYDKDLNSVFGTFKASNIQHLILDLRYNPGGSVNSAILLSSMITGQFYNEIFSTEQWNSELQAAIESNNPELLINRFKNKVDGKALNSLNLNKVYIIATENSASASELVINSLDPYINVVHIGTNTTGKYQASTTLYDSEDFSREGANRGHTYAMQPLIFKSLNAVGNTDYDTGLTPDIQIEESYLDLKAIGDTNETLLAVALADISGATNKISLSKSAFKPSFTFFKDSNSFQPFGNDMYVDKPLPSNFLNNTIFE